MKPTITLVALLAVASCKNEPPGSSTARQASRVAPSAPRPAPAPTDPTRPATAPTAIQTTTAKALCMTKGTVSLLDAGPRLKVTEPKIRGVVAGSTGEMAELRFVYRGPTQAIESLASGQDRLQLGLKLRAADGCNVVYVMWRLDDPPFLEVSIKRNRDQTESRECGTNGYRKIAKIKPIPTLVPGEAHTLRAKIEGGVLTAWINGAVVWRDALGTDAVGLVGPAGFRSDNVAYDFELDTDVSDATIDCASVVGD